MPQCPHRPPKLSDFAPFQQQYIQLIHESDVLAALEEQWREVTNDWSTIQPETSLIRHPPYTWSLREVLGHLTDSERIFGYRALRFARGDATNLPGFEENDYVRQGNFDRRDLSSLIDEFRSLRRANILMLENLGEEAWERQGLANNHLISVHNLAYLMLGHVRHHHHIIRKRLKMSQHVVA